MRCLAVCQDELVIRMLDEILLPGFEVEFIIENRPLARRLHEAGVTVTVGDPRLQDTYLKADIGPSTCVIIEDNGKRSLKKILEAVRDASGTLTYMLGIGAATTTNRAEEFHAEFPDVSYLSMSELFGGPLLTEFSRSLTRARVQQYQRYFSDADRVLILLHHDPDPDAMASGLALRNVLRRTKATAIIGAIQGVTRPENLRMVNLLDLHRSEEHTSELQSHRDLHSFPTRRSSDLAAQRPPSHEGNGHHRRHPGCDAAGEPADGQPARSP